MPQVLVAAAIGAGLYAGYRVLSQYLHQLTSGPSEARARERATARPLEKDLGRLELDPATGVYRPVRREG